jgi:diguanylate cyclase (GGDEF)-like protein
MLVGSLCLQLAAVIEFGGRPAPRALWLPAPVLFATLIPLLGDYTGLTALVSLVCAVLLGLTANAALRLGAAGGAPRWMLAIACDAAAAAVALRGANVWLVPDAHPGIFAAGLLDQAVFVALFAFTVVASLAFLLMHRERVERELQRLAAFDPLTGLLNRRTFMDFARRELSRAQRARETCTLLMLDVDRFKRVNDEHGHAAGDRVLAECAAALRGALRAADLVGRYGGEEFCALLSRASFEAALETAERLREAVGARCLGGLAPPVTVSIGAAPCATQDPRALDAAFARADEALYRAKAQGRNRVVASIPGERLAA